MSYKTLLIDLPSVYYRAFYALPESITDESGKPANAIKGSLSIIANIAENLKVRNAIGALDQSWRPSWRVALLPQYKFQRIDPDDENSEQSPESLESQVEDLTNLLLMLGMNIYQKHDYEADDVLATLAKQNRDSLIVTGDRDLFQLIDGERNVGVYLLSDKNNPIYDEDRFLYEFKFNPKNYLDFAVLRGDPSDGLPGVSGIGKITAQKMIASHSTIENLLIFLDSLDRAKLSKAQLSIMNSDEYLKRALQVSKAVENLTLDLLEQPDQASDLSPLTSYFKIEKQVKNYQRFVD